MCIVFEIGGGCVHIQQGKIPGVKEFGMTHLISKCQCAARSLNWDAFFIASPCFA